MPYDKSKKNYKRNTYVPYKPNSTKKTVYKKKSGWKPRGKPYKRRYSNNGGGYQNTRTIVIRL